MQTQQTNLTQASTSEAAQPIESSLGLHSIEESVQFLGKSMVKLSCVEESINPESQFPFSPDKLPSEIWKEILKKIYCNQNPENLKADLCSLATTSKAIRRQVLKLDLQLKMSDSEREQTPPLTKILKITQILKSLSLNYKSILKPINSQKNLDLFSKSTAINDQHLETVVILLPKLERLSLIGGKITNDGLKYLNSLSEIKELRLIDIDSITDAGISNLAGLKNLETLTVANCKNTTEKAMYNATKNFLKIKIIRFKDSTSSQKPIGFNWQKKA